jgi:hypothetical protein
MAEEKINVGDLVYSTHSFGKPTIGMVVRAGVNLYWIEWYDNTSKEEICYAKWATAMYKANYQEFRKSSKIKKFINKERK